MDKVKKEVFQMKLWCKRIITLVIMFMLGVIATLMYQNLLWNDSKDLPYEPVIRLNEENLNEEQEHLYINFTKDYYIMKKGEVFDYMSCIQGTNGNVTPIVTTVIEFERGSYLLQYKVESKTNPSIYRIYKKILIVE